MPAYIIQKDKVFNVYTTISDGCYFESGLTEDELRNWYREEYGKQSMSGLDERIERARQKGTSSLIDKSLEECISCNRAGPKEQKLSNTDFIAQFLTIRDRE